MIGLLLLACVAPSAVEGDEVVCDPRALDPGEVRARQVPCGDELIGGGEGRTGDWLLENAHARYVIRGTYAALSRLGQHGGTVIDAVGPDGVDLLLEYLPDADRSSITADNGDGWAALVLPGVTYRLGADDDALSIEGPTTGELQGLPGVRRTGASLSDDTAFFGADGYGLSTGSVVALEDVSRLAVSREGLWSDGADVAEPVDADAVIALSDGAPLARLPVVDGVASGRVPAGVTLGAEREGCVYEGLELRGCAYLRVRVADDTGADLVATVTDGVRSWPLPSGGGVVPAGPQPRDLWLWAGPAYSVAAIPWMGVDDARTVTLTREWEPGSAGLAAMAVEVAPDADSEVSPEEAATQLAAEGVGFAVMLADEEVPSVSADVHDAVRVVAASRAAGSVWSWSWSANGRKPGHGAVPSDGLSPLDVLAAAEGGSSNARLTVVIPSWAAYAEAEADPADWDPRPDALWIDSLEALPTYLRLLDAWVDVAPVGTRTWIGLEGDDNVPAWEAGIVAGRTSAGNGPRVTLGSLGRGRGGQLVSVVLEGPRWMYLRTVTLWTSAGADVHPVDGPGSWKWTVPAGTPWVVATAEGDQARPWMDEPSWAVSAPLWLQAP